MIKAGELKDGLASILQSPKWSEQTARHALEAWCPGARSGAAPCASSAAASCAASGTTAARRLLGSERVADDVAICAHGDVAVAA